jgi:site-specific recombinase XerD
MSGCIFSESSRHGYKWLLRGDNFAAAVAAFTEYLAGHGYRASVTSRYLGGVAHFLYWLKGRRRCIADIDEAMVGRFLDRHLPTCRCPKGCVRRDSRALVRQALGRLLEVLRDQGLITPIAPPSKGMLEAELVEFEHHLREVCGLAASTRDVYLHHVRHFLSARFAARPIDFTQLTAHDVRCFIKHHSPHWQPISLRAAGVSLRSYFRFKAINGVSIEALMAAIPQTARWRLAGLPKALTPAEVERFLAAFDRTRPKGLRDYAMARCLTDLGLRAIEVSRLQLQDVDWDEGTLAIRGKGRRVDLLPLPKELGVALAQYLRHGRPQSRSRALFLRERAPRDQPPKTNAIGAALGETARRCGLQGRFTGTRLLRHTVATRLVQRGASLKIIADLLRHRSLDTTTIYAKVDLPALARVVLPWPGRQP